MSNIIKSYDKLVQLEEELCLQEITSLNDFITYIDQQEESYTKFHQILLEKERLQYELTAKLAEKDKLESQLAKASVWIDEARERTSATQNQSEKIRQWIDSVKNLAQDKNFPPAVRDAIASKCQRAETVTEFSSDSETSNVECSASTDSDSWHLFPDHPTRPRYSDSFALTNSSDTSTDRNSAMFFTETFENIKNRSHEYKIKHLILGETCCVCELRIQCGKQAMKCMSCRAIVHQKCGDKLAKPCIPMDIMKPGVRDVKYFCSEFKPMIPGIVFHCVLYIEANGLKEPGLYALPVYDKNVTRLRELFFKGRGVPNLSHFDVKVVAAFFKDFLNLLQPPLITKKNFQRFEKYADSQYKENMPMDEFIEDFCLLPTANRDTLAFLMLHFQKIASSQESKMNAYFLAKTFTSILVEDVDKKSYKKEKFYRKVIERFIEAPEDVWKRILIKSM